MDPVLEVMTGAAGVIVAVVLLFLVPMMRTVIDQLGNLVSAYRERGENDHGTDPERIVALEAELKGLRTRMSDTEELVEARYRKLLARDRRSAKERDQEEDEEEDEREAQLAIEALHGPPTPPDTGRSLRRARRGRRPF